MKNEKLWKSLHIIMNGDIIFNYWDLGSICDSKLWQ